MGVNEQFDYVNTLRWVKGELDEILKLARNALEKYADENNPQYLHQCLEQLRQVHGVLQMVELYGASLLAEEIICVCHGLSEGQIERKEDACEVLMRALLQLPDYLERLKAGHRDVPWVLLPLMNDLRAARSAHLLSEGALFTPDISVIPPRKENSTKLKPEGDLRELARKLRSRYQFGLVGWYKNNKDIISLKRLDWVLSQFEQTCKSDEVLRLFWVANGVIEGVMLGAIEAGISIKLLLGQIDWQIKRLIEKGEENLQQSPPIDLLKNLLYYAGLAQAKGVRIPELQRAFQLNRYMPREEEINAAKASLGGANADLMQTVSAVIKEDLSKVEDTLDLYIRSTEKSTNILTPLVNNLQQIADTLGMLGLGRFRQMILAQHNFIQGIVSGKKIPNDAMLMEMASAILYVKSSLGNISWHEAQEDDAGYDMSQAYTMPAREYRQVRKTVMEEAASNILKVKDAFLAYLAGPLDVSTLEQVPKLLDEVRGALSVSMAPRIAKLVQLSKDYVEQQYIGKKHVPNAQEQDWFADVIAGIEYSLETIAEDRPISGSALVFSERSMNYLLNEKTDVHVLPVIENFGFDNNAIFADTTAEPTDALEFESTEDHLDFEENVSVPNPLPIQAFTTPEPQVQGLPPVRDEEVDDEIIQVFIEEADGELNTILENYPKWKKNVEDIEALKIIRRCFHTLKGSGRLVGAKSIGEVAWAIENMLNRVIDNTVPVDDAVFALLDKTLLYFPACVRQYQEARSDRPMSSQLAAIIGETDLLSKPRPVVTWVQDNKKEADDLDFEVGSASFFVADPPLPSMEINASPFLMAENEATADSELLEIKDEDFITVDDMPGEFMHHPEMSPVDNQESIREAVQFNFEDSVSFENDAERGEGPANEIKTETSVDKVLYEIFTAEAHNHLNVLQQFINECANLAGPWQVDEQVLRSMHTLHGSAHMAGFHDIAEVSGALENYVMALRNNGLEFPATAMEAIKACVRDIRHCIVDLSQNHGLLPEKNDLMGMLKEISVESSDTLLPHTSPQEYEEKMTPWFNSESINKNTTVKEAEASEQDELVEVFLMEASEIMDSTESILQQWSANLQDRNLTERLERELHTFKGGARLAGFAPMADLSHELETVLSAVRTGKLPVSQKLLDLVQTSYDRLAEFLDKAKNKQSLSPAIDLIEQIAAFAKNEQDLDPVERLAESSHSLEDAEDPMTEQENLALAEVIVKSVQSVSANIIPFVRGQNKDTVSMFAKEKELSAKELAANIFKAEKTGTSEQIRVRSDMLDKLVNYAAEVSISRSRIEQQVGTFRHNLNELQQTVDRVKEQLRRLDIETDAQIRTRLEDTVSMHGEDFDPLEFDRYSNVQQLSRSLGESVNDLVNIRDNLDVLTSESETLLVQQARVNTELQEGLMRTRLVSFAGLVPRLRRVVRQTARDLNKQVELHVVGADVELDRNVLDRMAGPLEHMLRNAMDHGIENTEIRKSKGKPESGTILIRLSREGAEVLLQVQDDGCGINLEAIREKAIKVGFIESDMELNESDLMQFILEPGFTTAQKVTQISGRGVGLDVVSNEIKQLGGHLQIDTAKNQGTNFVVRLPLTLSVSQALIVQVAEQFYAISLSSIVGITRIKKQDLHKALNSDLPVFNYASNEYLLQSLSNVLGIQHDADEEITKYPLLLVHLGGHQVAFQVEALVGSREIVVKPIGPQLSTIRGLSGATILGDGKVVLILDMSALVRYSIVSGKIYRKQVAAKALTEIKGIQVMVVDDSITVRKVTTRFLERHQMQVSTAKDGVDALGKLQEQIPDIILLDIEMPRMDGYELASVIRNDARLKHIPIIMITSRTGSKHRDRAMQIGVNIYMGKPYQEHELIQNIQSLLSKKRLL